MYLDLFAGLYGRLRFCNSIDRWHVGLTARLYQVSHWPVSIDSDPDGDPPASSSFPYRPYRPAANSGFASVGSTCYAITSMSCIHLIVNCLSGY